MFIIKLEFHIENNNTKRPINENVMLFSKNIANYKNNYPCCPLGMF